MGCLIDTSVLVASSLKGHEHRDPAMALLESIKEPKLVNTIVLSEYAHVLRKMVEANAAASLLADAARAYLYHAVPLSTLLAAMPHFRHGVRDAIIGQHAIENGWKLVTLDRGFRRFVPGHLLVMLR